MAVAASAVFVPVQQYQSWEPKPIVPVAQYVHKPIVPVAQYVHQPAVVIKQAPKIQYVSQGWEHKPVVPVVPQYVHQPLIVKHKEIETPANYGFSYETHDEHTGDIKRQSETAVDGVVSGQYSLIDSDGFRRVVEYTADDHNGFQAVVRREPTDFKVPQLIKKVEPVYKYVQHAPVAHVAVSVHSSW